MKLKFPTTRWMLIVLASLFISSVGNWAFWSEFFTFLPSYSLRNLGFTVGTFVIITALISTLFSLIIWPKVAKIFLTVLFIITSLGCYFMVTYGIVIDSDMLVNVLQTDIKESHDLLSWKLFATIFALGILPSVGVWKINLKKQTALLNLKENATIFVISLLVAVISIFVVYQDFASLMRNQPHIRFLITPLNTLYGFGQLIAKPLIHGQKEFKKIGEDAKINDLNLPNRQTPLLVLVVGETARSGNLSINGYQKPTTPKLEILKKKWRN